MWQKKYASVVRRKGMGVDIRPCSEGDFPHRAFVVRETVYSVFSYCIFSVQFHALTFIMVPLDIETLDVPTKRSYFNWMIGKAICNSDPNSTKLCHKNHGHPFWQTRKASVKQTRPWHKLLYKEDLGQQYLQ